MHCISILVLHIFCVLTTAEIKGKNLVSKMHLSAPPPCDCGYCPSKGGDYFYGYFIMCCPCFVIQYFASLIGLQSSCFFCGSFVFFFCLVFVVPLWASVCVCLVVACREGAGLLALFVVSGCEFVIFPLVTWAR